MKSSEKIIQTPIGDISVRVKKGIRSYKDSAFAIKKVAEAEQSLANLKVSVPQE